MTLSLYRIPFLAPYFVEMQRKSFLDLLKTGLIYELSKRNFISNKNLQLIFYPENYQLIPPEHIPRQAILKSKTYGCKLYLPLQLTNYKTKQLKLQWVHIGNLPLMTKRGHFIINGSPRVIVNQLVRSPGIYCQQRFDQKKREIYYADLIPNRGTWLRIEIDVKKRMWVKMKNACKIPILVFLLAIGIDDQMISRFISKKNVEFLENSKYETEKMEDSQTKEQKYPHPNTIQEALLIFYSTAYPKIEQDKISLEKVKNFLFRKFFNRRTYDLSRLGRIKLNKKLKSQISLTTHVLTKQDLVFATDYLIQFEDGKVVIDDIDHLKNRRVRASGELIQNQLGTGFIRLEKLIREKIQDSNFPISTIITTKPINGALREFFGSSPLSQFMDQTNPLAELTHKRRISSLGPGGISRETAGMAIRGIHPTQYGRVCPIETPEGHNAGLVNSLTAFARINYQGFIETPFYPVYQGQVQKWHGVSFLSAAQEEWITSAPGDLKTNYFHFLPSNTIPVREKGEFKKLPKNQVEYMSVSPIQMISIATSLIPFLEHDDANRALMGSNMQRQAVPLLLPEKAIVGTGFEARVVSDSGHGIQAQKSGFVSYVSPNHIKITSLSCSQNKKIYRRIPNKYKNFSHSQNITESSKKNWSKKKPSIKSTQKKNYLIYSNINTKKKFLRTNFLYLKQILLRTTMDCSFAAINLFQSMDCSKTAINLFQSIVKKNISLIKNESDSAIFQKYTPTQTWVGFSKSSSIEKNFGVFQFTDKRFFYSKFTSPVLIDYPNSIFFSTKKLLSREYHSSKNHFSNLSEKNIPAYFQFFPSFIIKNKTISGGFSKPFFHLNYNRHIIIECKKLIYSQIFVQKKNLKYLFFYRSKVWNTIEIKRFTKIQSIKKSYLTKSFSGVNSSTGDLFQNPLKKPVWLQSNLPGCFATTKRYRFYFQNRIRKKLSGINSNNKNIVNNLFPPLSTKKSESIMKYRPDSLLKLSTKFQLKKKIVYKNLNFETFKTKITNFNFLSEFYFFQENINYLPQLYQRSNQNTCIYQTPLVHEGEWVQKGDIIADGAASVGGELALGKTILVAYMPWEGYNFEDAILISQRLIYDNLYTSIHIQKYEIEISYTEYGIEQITSTIPDISDMEKYHLDYYGIVKIGSWVTQGYILVGKVTPIKEKKLSGHEKLLADILGKSKKVTARDTSLRVPKNVTGRVVHIELLETENVPPGISIQGPGKVHIYVAEKRHIQVGDKMSGRHGNKGIVSKILPQQDMPYLPDGTPIDMVLNPLGVPSRMNVGQIFECLLGLAGKELNEQFKISCFDEMNGPDASRTFTYSKLFQARLKTGKKWLFNPNSPGKVKLFDGRTGECFHQTVTVGQPYILKLVHLVDEKIHARSTGPYSLVTQQPLKGRSKHGGQRLGEMEVWALEGFGAAYTLQELLTTKSDDMKGRYQVVESILKHKPITLGTPESFKVLLSELQSLCLNIGLYSMTNTGIPKKIDMMVL